MIIWKKGTVSSAYLDKVEAIVEDWMRRRKLVPSMGRPGDRARHVSWLLAAICIKTGVDAEKLWAGHPRARKQLHRWAQRDLKFGLWDPQLEASLVEAVDAENYYKSLDAAVQTARDTDDGEPVMRLFHE